MKFKSKKFMGMAGLVLVMILCIAQIAQEVEANDGLDQAMQAFVQAMKIKNSQGVLAAFSRTTPWRFVSYTMSYKGSEMVCKLYDQKSYHYSEMERDFKARSGWYNFFMVDGAPNTGETSAIRSTDKWHRRGTTFVVDPKNPKFFYVKWGQEGQKWVITEIGATSY